MRVHHVAHWLDEAFEIPVIRRRVGLDPMIGLIPTAGDWLTWVPSIYILLEGMRLKLPVSMLAQMAFNIARFRDGMHRYFRDYADSWLHEVGPHIVELPFWALELGRPARISAAGGRFATESIADIPDTFQALWEFPGRTVSWNLMQHNAYHFGELAMLRQVCDAWGPGHDG